MAGALCTKDFSLCVFCARDCVGITSVGLGGCVMGRFQDMCGVESLHWAPLGMELLLREHCLAGVLLLE